MLCYKLPKVGQFLQELGEEESVVGVVGLKMEPQSMNDTFLNALNV